MTFDDLKKHFGSIQRAAAELGLVRQAVYRWRESGIPLGQQYRIQVKTRGRLKVQMPKEERAA